MEFKVLGPLEVVEDGRALRFGGGKERALLALLLLHANEVVPAGVLIDELWGHETPATAAKALQVYVSRLRKRLGSEVLVTRSPGYALEVRPEHFDVARFEQLVAEARSAAPADAASLLSGALALWRGPPFVEFTYESFAQAEIARLEELRLAALEARIEADLACGRQLELIGELEALVSRHPLRERLRFMLILALYRSGRQADALAAYKDARRALTDDLGLELSGELRELERRILAHDPSLDLQASPQEAERESQQHGKSRKRILAAVAALLVLAGIATGAVELSAGSSHRSLVALPNSVALIDPGTNRVVADVFVPERPTSIAAYGGRVWVLHPDLRTLSVLDTGDHSLLRTIGLGGAPSGLAADGHGAWVSDARTAAVTRIDPGMFTVVGTIKTRPVPFKEPSPCLNLNACNNRPSYAGRLAIGFRSLWLAAGNRTIVRIDLRTRRVIARIARVENVASLGGIVVGAGSVWVAGPFQGSPLTRIDPVTNRVVARIAFAKDRSSDVAFGGKAVWVSDAANNQVWEIDPSADTPLGSTKVGQSPEGLAYGAGSIWVANAGDGTVSRIDPTTGKVIRTISVGGSPNAIAVTPNRIWVTVD
jgi:YVTN family beta-propeller protein